MTSLLRRYKRPKAPRKTSLRVPGHYKWIGGFPCCTCGTWPVERHHVRKGIPHEDKGGKDEKPHDKWCVPLCAVCHAEYHNSGHDTFEAAHSIDLKKRASDLWERSPHGQRYRAQQREDERG